MEFILIIITLSGGVPEYIDKGPYTTFTECSEFREKEIFERGRPIINYQAICVISSEKTYAKRYND